VVAFAPPVSAETVGVLEFGGAGAPAVALERFEDSLVDGLEGAGFEVRKRKSVAAALAKSEFVTGCHFGPCLATVHKVLKLDRVLVVRVQVIGSTYTFVASVVDTKTGGLILQVSETCAACSIDDAAAEASMLGPALLLQGAEKSKLAAAARTGQSASSTPSADKGGGARVASYIFLGASVIAGGVGAYLWLGNDDSSTGVPIVAGAGVGVVSGFSMLLLSSDF